MALVKFYSVSQQEYDGLDSVNNGALYFTNDTHRIYRGTEFYSNNLVILGEDDEFPTSGVEGLVYVKPDSYEIKIWDETNDEWVSIGDYLPLSGGTVTGDILRDNSKVYHRYASETPHRIAYVEFDEATWNILLQGKNVSPINCVLCDENNNREIIELHSESNPAVSEEDEISWRAPPLVTWISFCKGSDGKPSLLDAYPWGISDPNVADIYYTFEHTHSVVTVPDTVPYIYGPATTDHIGGIKVGSNLTVDSEGVLSAVIPQGVQPSDANPSMDGAANSGTSVDYSRADHVHPTDTSRAAVTDLDHYLPLSGGTVTGDILRQLSGDSYYHVWNNTNNSINITTQMAFIKEDVWDNLYKGSSVSPVTIKTSISTNLTDSSSYDEIPSYTWTTTDPESSSIDSPVTWHCVENPTDTIIAYYDSTRNGTWLKFGSDFILCGTAIPSSNGTVVKHEGDEDLIPYIYGPASATHLGGIKVGSNLTVDSEGVLSAVVPQGVQPSNDDPLPDAATSYAGISESYSRSDHVHPLSSYIINFELAIDSEDFTSFPLELHGENIQICDSTGTELTDITISDLLSRVQGGYNVQVNCDYGVALGEPAGSRIFTAHPSDLGSKSLDFQFTFSAAIFGSGQHLYNALAQFNDVSDGNDSILCSGKIYQIVQVNELEPLEPATPSILGGVKVGENLTIDSDGTLNATVPSLAGYATETYVNTQVSNHATNSTIHVTASDKTNWDDKTTVIWKKW